VNTYGEDLMGGRRLCRHSADFKATANQECLKPGIAIAAVALVQGLNANMLRNWAIDAEHKPPAPVAAVNTPMPESPSTSTFVSLALPAQTVERLPYEGDSHWRYRHGQTFPLHALAVWSRSRRRLFRGKTSKD
jgi:transposase